MDRETNSRKAMTKLKGDRSIHSAIKKRTLKIKQHDKLFMTRNYFEIYSKNSVKTTQQMSYTLSVKFLRASKL